MPVTNTWLADPVPTKQLTCDTLEERILNLLSSTNVCVLATTGPDGPLATPVRYFHLDFTIIFTTDPHSPKMRNLRHDPRVSVGIVASLVGQASSRGAQLFGHARILDPDHPEHAHYWEAVRWQSDHVERSQPLSQPPAETLGVIAADRIVYTEHWLRRAGYAPRQHWRAPPRIQDQQARDR